MKCEVIAEIRDARRAISSDISAVRHEWSTRSDEIAYDFDAIQSRLDRLPGTMAWVVFGAWLVFVAALVQ